MQWQYKDFKHIETFEFKKNFYVPNLIENRYTIKQKLLRTEITYESQVLREIPVSF